MKVKLVTRISFFVILALFLTVLLLGAEMAHYTPYSGRGYVEMGVVPLYSRIGGTIDRIYVETDRNVKCGDPIFRLDDRNLKAEIKRLEAALANTVKQLKALDSQIQSAGEEELKAQNIRRQAHADLERDTRLFNSNVLSRKMYEESKLKCANADQDLRAAQSRLNALRNQRGDADEESSEEKQLNAELEIARNNLNDATVRAPESGRLDYHQLYRGQAVIPQERYAVIHDNTRLTVYVDLLEKSAGELQIGQPASVAFDILPGTLFKAEITGFGRVLQARYTAPTQLANIEDDPRWIRTAGRVRVQLRLTDSLPDKMLFTGSKVAVAFFDDTHPLLSCFNRIWIRTVAFCNYIY